jgi:hypothetical protein
VHGGELELKQKENRRGLLRVRASVHRDREADACAKLEGEERPSKEPAKELAARNSIATPTCCTYDLRLGKSQILNQTGHSHPFSTLWDRRRRRRWSVFAVEWAVFNTDTQTIFWILLGSCTDFG